MGLIASGSLVHSWAWDSFCVEFPIFSPCHVGFPLGSSVSSQLPKTCQYMDWLIGYANVMSAPDSSMNTDSQNPPEYHNISDSDSIFTLPTANIMFTFTWTLIAHTWTRTHTHKKPGFTHTQCEISFWIYLTTTPSLCILCMQSGICFCPVFPLEVWTNLFFDAVFFYCSFEFLFLLQ